MNFNSIFEQFEEKLVGDDGKSIIDKIRLLKMPLYFYCVMPLKGGVDLYGKIDVGTGTIENDKPVWDKAPTGTTIDNPTPIVGTVEDGGEIKYEKIHPKGTLPKLTFNGESTMVIKALEETDPAPVDIADLFNLHTGSNIIFEYGMQLGAGNNEPIKLSKLELASEGDSEPAKIQFHARLVLPLEIEATKDINLSFTKLFNKDDDDDLFKRSEATSNDIVEELIDSLEYARLNAYFPSSPSVIQYFVKGGVENTETNVRVEIDPKIDGIAPYKLDMRKNEPFEIRGDDFSKILKEYPFAPDIQFVIPQGCFYIRHNFEYELKMELGTKFNGKEILIFGGKK